MKGEGEREGKWIDCNSLFKIPHPPSMTQTFVSSWATERTAYLCWCSVMSVFFLSQKSLLKVTGKQARKRTNSRLHERDWSGQLRRNYGSLIMSLKRELRKFFPSRGTFTLHTHIFSRHFFKQQRWEGSRKKGTKKKGSCSKATTTTIAVWAAQTCTFFPLLLVRELMACLLPWTLLLLLPTWHQDEEILCEPTTTQQRFIQAAHGPVNVVVVVVAGSNPSHQCGVGQEERRVCAEFHPPKRLQIVVIEENVTRSR